MRALPDEGKYKTIGPVTEENVAELSEKLHLAFVRARWSWIGEARPGVSASRIREKLLEFVKSRGHLLPTGGPCASVACGGLRVVFDGDDCVLQVQNSLKEAMDER